MTEVAPSRWLFCSVGVGLIFVVIAIALRFFAGYPICPNDEASWIYIAGQLDRGVHWPVSGPAFIETARELSRQIGGDHARTIPLLGIIGVFVAISSLVWGYRKFNMVSASQVLITLSLSSYFWAPLMEARPQQWGQVLVFLGVISGWCWLHRKGGWLFFLVIPVISVTHILSHAVLAFLCGMLVMADFAEKRPLTKRHLCFLLVVLLSLAVYVLPQGPYAAMLADVEHVQLKQLSLGRPYLAILLSIAAVVAVFLQPKWHWRPNFTNVVAQGLVRRRTATGLSILCVVFTAIAMQAYLLPAEAWLPYGGSWRRFLLFQVGNLMFAGFFIAGIYSLIEGLQTKRFDPMMGRLLIWILIALGLLSLLSIGASWWLLHTNWFLRILNYGIFFAAIVAAIGIDRLTKNWPTLIKYALLGVGISASLLAVVRPPQLLGC